MDHAFSFNCSNQSSGPALANRRPCSNFPSVPFSLFLPLFSLSVPLPPFPFHPLPATRWPLKTSYGSGIGAPRHFFGWAKSLPQPRLPSLAFTFFPFLPSPPLPSLRSRPSNTARVWQSAVSCFSGVWGGAPGGKRIWCILALI